MSDKNAENLIVLIISVQAGSQIACKGFFRFPNFPGEAPGFPTIEAPLVFYYGGDFSLSVVKPQWIQGSDPMSGSGTHKRKGEERNLRELLLKFKMK